MRCPGCMELIPGGAEVCPQCGTAQSAKQKDADALPAGILLQDNRFLIGRELVRSDFGITYISYDSSLQKKVAIREYFPRAIASREKGKQTVDYSDPEMMDRSIKNALQEAQKMRRLDRLEGTAHVLDIFRQNGTAYLVMDYADGVTLDEYLRKHGRPDAKECFSLMMPVLDIMGRVHEAGLIHCDICPDNILIQPDGAARILNFSAAKDLRMESGNAIPLARNGFAPPELYAPDSSIGPWTDVYAICATMYYCMVGSVPPGSGVRSTDSCRLPFPEGCSLPQKMVEVLNAGMELQPEQRIRDVQALKRRLDTVFAAPAPAEPVRQAEAAEAPGFRDKFLHMFRGRGKRDAEARKPVTVSIKAPFSSPVFTGALNVSAFDTESDETVLASGTATRPARAILRQKETGKEVTVSRNCFVVGRASRNAQSTADWQLDDPTRRSSRQHIAIIFDGEYFYVQDITERNATRLNGQLLANCPLPADRRIFPKAYRLHNGDEIALAADGTNSPAVTLEFCTQA